jgi:hypothetical protein
MKISLKRLDHILILLLAFFILTRIYGITALFGGSQGWNDSSFSIYAKNYLEFGFRSGILPYIGFYHSQPVYYANHPPLIPLLVLAAFKVFGVFEWSARLVPLVFSTMSAVLLFKIVKKYWNSTAGYFALFFSAATPMLFHFGRMVCFEPVLTFIALLAVYFYGLWLETKRTAYMFLVSISFLIGAFIDFPILFLAFGLMVFVTFKVKDPRVFFLSILATILPLFIGFGLYFWQISLLKSVSSVEKAYSHWANFHALLSFNYYATEITRIITTINPIVIGLFIFWACKNMLQKSTYREWLVLILLIFGALNLVVAPAAAVMHTYWLYYFAFPCIIAASAEISGLAKKIQIILVVLFILFSIPVIGYSIHRESDTIRAEIGNKIKPFIDKDTLLVAAFPEEIYYSGARNVLGLGQIDQGSDQFKMMQGDLTSSKYKKIIVLRKNIKGKYLIRPYRITYANEEFTVYSR